ncbi:helix-turn-helix domain-containing protein [Streptomyces heilongjiangensis]|uniref:Helix-turn-helix domain-containing protein n=1 Tax=Streptomyces heilongjiangensis TaxID=945052 RepID=A0ABW1BDD7_9ACTN
MNIAFSKTNKGVARHTPRPLPAPPRTGASPKVTPTCTGCSLTGHTVSGWIRERRLEQCHRDLTGPALDALPVGAVGGRWGFPDPARFSHAFKAAHGMSPGQARAAAQASRQ